MQQSATFQFQYGEGPSARTIIDVGCLYTTLSYLQEKCLKKKGYANGNPLVCRQVRHHNVLLLLQPVQQTPLDLVLWAKPAEWDQSNHMRSAVIVLCSK